MSEGASNSGKLFRKFHDRVSQAAGCDLTKEKDRLPFAPDWLDSLVARIATGELVEATAAWVLYRGNANHREHASHIYGKSGSPSVETALGQRNCALEIAWLRAGHRREWLDAPLEMLRAEAARRGVRPFSKTLISEAFILNRRRGIIASDTGHRLALVPVPKVGDSPEFHRRKGAQDGKSPEYQRFLQWAKVAHSPEFKDLEDARSSVKRINKFLLSEYKKWLKQEAPRTNGARSYKPSETSTNPPPPDDSVAVGSPPTKAEEEEVHPLAVESSRFARFKDAYPRQQFDEAEAKPLFEGLKPAEQDLVLERLPFFLNCDLWQHAPRYIPLASNWLKKNKYRHDPPPLLAAAVAGAGEPVLSRKDQEVIGRVQRGAERLKRGGYA
jgi:hypothetical protein